MSSIAPSAFVMIAALMIVVGLLLRALARNAAEFAVIAAGAASSFLRTLGTFVIAIMFLLLVGGGLL